MPVARPVEVARRVERQMHSAIPRVDETVAEARILVVAPNPLDVSPIHLKRIKIEDS